MNTYQRSRLNEQDFSTNSRNFLQKSRNGQNYRNQLDEVVAIANRQFLPPNSRNENGPSSREYLPPSHDPIGKEYLPPRDQELNEGVGNTNGEYLPPIKDSAYNENSGREYLPPSDEPGYSYDKPQNLDRQYLPPSDYPGQNSMINIPNKEYLPPDDETEYHYNKPNRFSDPDRKYLPPISSGDIKAKIKDTVVIGGSKTFRNNSFQNQKHNINKPSRVYLPPTHTSNDAQNGNANFVISGIYDGRKGYNYGTNNRRPNLEYLPPDDEVDDLKFGGYPSESDRQYLPPTNYS